MIFPSTIQPTANCIIRQTDNHEVVLNTQILKEMITVIRIEQERRSSKLKDEDPNIAYDHWLFTDEPFLNELCLMLLVTLRHQIERELIGLAARVNEGCKEISGQQYQEKINNLRKTKSKFWDWDEIRKRLKLESEFCEKYKFIEALRHLSNSYKHDLSMKPNEELLSLLSLETGVNYASLPESDALRKGFADLIDLKENADYCDITAQFVEIASNFLVEVESRITLSKVNWGTLSLNPNDFAR